MTSKEALETIGMTKTNNIKSASLSKPRVMYLVKELRKKEIQTIKQDLNRLEELEKYACKYKSLVSGKLWRDGKERTKWFNKIRNQKDWIDCLSKLREFGSNDEEQFLRVVKHLDTQVLYWALSSLEKEIKRYSEEKFEDER